MAEKDNLKWLERQIIGIHVYAILLLIFIIILIGLLVYMGLIITATYKIGVGEEYELFRDILTIILAVSGLSIAIVGYGIYHSILKHAEKSMKKREEDFILLSTALLYVDLGFFHWQHYNLNSASIGEYVQPKFFLQISYLLWNLRDHAMIF